MDCHVLIGALQQQHRVVALRLRAVQFVAQQLRQIEKRVEPCLPANFARGVHADQRVGLELLHLLDQRRGQRVDAPAGAHQHCLRDRQRQRQVQRENRPVAKRRGDFDTAAETRDAVLHHIHPDPAPGDLGNFVRGGESGSENGIDQLRLRGLGVGCE